MSGWTSGWRLALRLARRDLLRHRARAVIALVMITLPVFAVVAADILIQTAQVSAAEGIERRLGTVATAELSIPSGDMRVTQGPDPQQGWGSSNQLARPTTVADIERVIGSRQMLPAPTATGVLVLTPHGREPVDVDEVDGDAPLARGLYRLDEGRWPRTPDEVVVNQAMRDRGVGDTLRIVDRAGTESVRHIVGLVVDPRWRSHEVVVALPGSMPTYGSAEPAWLVDGPPITWDQVQRLNDLGVLVTDRYIATHPAEFPDPMSADSGDDTMLQIVALITVMVLIEVVLLAGPAFAVGARKQQRSLALQVASGGTPAQSRRTILAGGVLLGAAAAVVGVAGGIAGAWLLRPLAQRFSAEWLGPFDVPWLHLAAVAAFALVSALVASLVPAWIASRQNVVAVLAGRRGDAKPGRAFPLLGVVLLAIGVLMAVRGAGGHGELMVAWSAVVCVLGMVLLVPVVVVWVARLAGRFPLAVRFAARDAVRHRTRTTPAVAAVAATVAGVVALGISTSSDEKENRETYQPTLLMGDAVVKPYVDYYLDQAEPKATDWDRVASVVRQRVPRAGVTPVAGVQQNLTSSSSLDVTFLDPARAGTDPAGDDGWIAPGWASSSLGSDVLVSDGAALPGAVRAVVPGREVTAALEAGRAVVLTSDRSQTRLDRVAIRVQTLDDRGTVTAPHTVVVPATVLPADPERMMPVRALLPPAVAERAGLAPATVALDVRQPGLSKAAERDLSAALKDLATPAELYVERGYQTPFSTAIVRWVLAALGAVLMLGGTLTASFLALADARPDLATLSAVGAAPRTRRAVGAAYTFVVAFVGAVLGMLVGFVPGLAITWPLTAHGYPGGHGPYVEIPWLMIAVVVLGLPVLTAAVVALCTRSRLPIATRIG